MGLFSLRYIISRFMIQFYFMTISDVISPASWEDLVFTLETHGRSLEKWVCIFPIFHAVVLLDSSN